MFVTYTVLIVIATLTTTYGLSAFLLMRTR